MHEGLELTALETKVISHTGLPRVRFSQGRSEKPTVLRCMFAWKVILQLKISTIWGRLGQRVRARWDAAATEAWGRGGAGAANQGLGIQVGTGRCQRRERTGRRCQGNSETMHDSYLHTFSMRALTMISLPRPPLPPLPPKRQGRLRGGEHHLAAAKRAPLARLLLLLILLRRRRKQGGCLARKRAPQRRNHQQQSHR